MTSQVTVVRTSVAYVKASNLDVVYGWSETLPDGVFLEISEARHDDPRVTDIKEVDRLPKNWPLKVLEDDWKPSDDD